jgi:hypothetical protein
MERVYVYTDRSSKELLYVVEAVDVRTANALVITDLAKSGAGKEVAGKVMEFMDCRMMPVLKEKKKS